LKENMPKLQIRNRVKLTLTNEVETTGSNEQAARQLEEIIKEAIKKLPGIVGAVKIKIISIAKPGPGGWEVLVPGNEDD
jgi:hypothetical protein